MLPNCCHAFYPKSASVKYDLEADKESIRVVKNYERIVEGNYVDNLIKAQRARSNITKAKNYDKNSSHFG